MSTIVSHVEIIELFAQLSFYENLIPNYSTASLELMYQIIRKRYDDRTICKFTKRHDIEDNEIGYLVTLTLSGKRNKNVLTMIRMNTHHW